MINQLKNKEEIKVVNYKNIKLYVIPGGKLKKKKDFKEKFIGFLKWFVPYVIFCFLVSLILYIYILLIIK